MRRLVITALSALTLTAPCAVLAAAMSAPPAANTACADGETAAATTCAPFCLPGRHFDYANTGLCLLDAPPPPPPPPQPNNVMLQ